jgi:hypothetical protein
MKQTCVICKQEFETDPPKMTNEYIVIYPMMVSDFLCPECREKDTVMVRLVNLAVNLQDYVQ